ncbi:MAG: DUF4197 domain-containing protein [Deltaproteobacteria bacterium]|jgi:hypothetical protein
MKTIRHFSIILLLTLGLFQLTPAHAQFGDLLQGIKKAVGLGGGLTEERIIEGLKEALEIGTQNAVETVSKVGGYYENPKIKIPLPGAVQKVEKIVRAAGYGTQLDAFEMSMNRAAETAAPEAKGVFWDAIKQMKVADAQKILHGQDNEATLYFKEKTHDRLGEIFKPMVRNAMSGVGVTKAYQDLEEKVQSIPFVGNWTFDLDEYVKNGALEGLFLMLGEEEKKIRQDPAARVTDLLKEVFGSQ